MTKEIVLTLGEHDVTVLREAGSILENLAKEFSDNSKTATIKVATEPLETPFDFNNCITFYKSVCNYFPAEEAKVGE